MNKHRFPNIQSAAFTLVIAAVLLLIAGGVSQAANTSCNLNLPPNAAMMVVDVNEYKNCNTLSSFQSLFFADLAGLPTSGYDITDRR